MPGVQRPLPAVTDWRARGQGDRLLAHAERQAGSLPANVQLLSALLRSPVIRAQFAD